MRQQHLKKLVIAFTATTLALTLTACSGAGPNAATRLIKRVTDGNEATLTTNGSDLSISNFLLVATQDGSAVIVGTIVNHAATTDSLLSISTADGAMATITGEQKLLLDKPIRFEGDSANAKAVFAGVGASAGKNVTLSLAFARAGVVKIDAIIRDQRDTYANITSGAKLVK